MTIKERRPGKDVFGYEGIDIAFAVNTEGFNDSGFAGQVAERFWPELANTEPCELGTVMSKTADDGRTYHALVCHSLKNGWGGNQAEIIEKCFNNIPDSTERTVASIAIGRGLVGQLTGADTEQIEAGMEASKTSIILYG
ncbi:hypothetical protein FWC31_02685 [Candidatus Saccharibacteria bacterium]|nr:hypothetical protein [Candidatus Saccharibacteria bacterium]